jgi:6,7-dimethyl-8-ribityllumazine synthase
VREGAEATPLAGAEPFRFAVVVARFHDSITSALRDAALSALKQAGARDGHVHVLAVPGAFEIPQAARIAAATGRFDAVVCLGCIVRGETPHFDYIASAVAHGIMSAAGDTGVPMTFGVLTANTIEQARERAGDDDANKGREAAAAAIEMAALHRVLTTRAPRSRTLRA